jgi:hypothetical protein
MMHPQKGSPVSDFDALAARYVAVWNEPSPDARRAAIAVLFAPDAAHFTPTREFRGHAALETRVAEAHDQWVAGGTHAFRAVPGATGHHDGAFFRWEMYAVEGGAVAGGGFDFVRLDEAGRITADHQFTG